MSNAGTGTIPGRGELKGGKSRIEFLKGCAALFRLLPPNLAHKAAIKVLKYGLVPLRVESDDPSIGIKLWDLKFSNPVGMAAGFDKDSEALDGLFGLGFGFVEVGTVTLKAQPGNPKPNLFRLRIDEALINRLGFPSQGLEEFKFNLERCLKNRRGNFGVNIGVNAKTQDGAKDIESCILKLAQISGYITINVSCPNMPGISSLQSGNKLTEIISRAQDALDAASGNRRPPLLVKVSPDLNDEEIFEISEIGLKTGLDGFVACNTTVKRPFNLNDEQKDEIGGLSGPPLVPSAKRVLVELYKNTNGKIPLISCGGIRDAADVYDRIRKGASLTQMYTAFIYNGPGLINEIKSSLTKLLHADGFLKLSDAIGVDHQQKKSLF